MQGDRASPEEEAVVIAYCQIGGRQILGFGDVLGDEDEDVLFVEESCVEGRAEGPGEVVAGRGLDDAAGEGGAIDAMEEGAVLDEFQLGGCLVEIGGGDVLPDGA